MTIRCAKCGAEHHTRSAANFEYRLNSATEQELLSCSRCRPQIVCNKCGVSIDRDKAHELFDRRKDRAVGFQYACRKCRSEQNKHQKKAKKAKEEINKRAKERYHKRNEAKIKKDREHEKKLEGYAEKILGNQAVGTTARTFHFGLKLILERQFELYYDDIKSLIGQQKKRRVIEDALFEFKDILTRVSDRMKRVSDAESMSDIDSPTNGVKERRISALLVLGLPGTATDEDIKKRYKRLAKDTHPDHGGSPEKMAEINAAMAVLEVR